MADIDPNNNLDQFKCDFCPRSFRTKGGKGVHERSQHPVEANERIAARVESRLVVSEEMELYAAAEAAAQLRGVKFMNQHLMEVFGKSTPAELNRLKYTRKKMDYKQLVAQKVQALTAAAAAVLAAPSIEDEEEDEQQFFSAESDDDVVEDSPPVERVEMSAEAQLHGAISALVIRARRIESHQSEALVAIAEAVLQHLPITPAQCCEWLSAVIPENTRTGKDRPRRARKRKPDHPHRRRVTRPSHGWRARRREYARMQQLWEKDMSKAAKLVLDGGVSATVPSMEEMVDFWTPILTTPSKEIEPEVGPVQESPELRWIAAPITCKEIQGTEVPLKSASGPDKITGRQWRSVPVVLRALFYNTLLAVGGFTADLLLSRTVFVPKKDGSSTPAEFRPISVASVVVRQLHKVYAARLMRANLVDERQRGLRDGCAENVIVLATVLKDAKANLKYAHVASLDVAKAFDSVSHHALLDTLRGLGLPGTFVDYMGTVYRSSKTVLEVSRERSQPITVLRGVRQGDPLSTILFALVVDRVLKRLPSEVGYTIRETKINGLAYADDIVLYASTTEGMRRLLKIAEREAAKFGLEFNPNKCVAMSILINGRLKKYKITTEQLFTIAGGPIKQLGPTEGFRYLGVNISPLGVAKPGGKLHKELDNITKAPLTPQQRMKILRCFLVPRYYHLLVLSLCRRKTLKALDLQVRTAIRKWLSLPHDTPLGYFHARCRDGGLGIPSFVTSVPGMILDRLTAMSESTSAAVRDASNHLSVHSAVRWAERILTYDGTVLDTSTKRTKYWASRLHQSIDGCELREAANVPASCAWVDSRSAGLSGTDYVQFHRLRINALPTRVRTSRGRRGDGVPLACRAGCQSTETAAHIVQGCHRTHGGRIKRHDQVCRIAANALSQLGWAVLTEPRLQLSPATMLKPDLIVSKSGSVNVIDAQVVYAGQPLDASHRTKVSKYDTPQLKQHVAQELGVLTECVKVTSITLSWKGVWSSKSARDLTELGLSKLLPTLTTVVLRGSHLNWSRWNKMTTYIFGHRRDRVGIG